MYRQFSCDPLKDLATRNISSSIPDVHKIHCPTFSTHITTMSLNRFMSTLLAENGASTFKLVGDNARIHGLPETSRRRKLPVPAPDRFSDSSPKRESSIVCPPRNLQRAPPRRWHSYSEGGSPVQSMQCPTRRAAWDKYSMKECPAFFHKSSRNLFCATGSLPESLLRRLSPLQNQCEQPSAVESISRTTITLPL
jgi:hypothetical protein